MYCSLNSYCRKWLLGVFCPYALSFPLPFASLQLWIVIFNSEDPAHVHVRIGMAMNSETQGRASATMHRAVSSVSCSKRLVISRSGQG